MGILHRPGLREAIWSGSLPAPKRVAGLAGWWDPTQLAGLADNDVVTIWTDFSGKSRHASAAGAARATYKTGILKGRPVLRFSGAQHYETAGFDLSSTNAVTVFIMAVPTDVTAQRMWFEFGNMGSRSDSFGMFQDTNRALVSQEHDGAASAYITNYAQVLGSPASFSMVYDRSLAQKELIIYVNGQTTHNTVGVDTSSAFGAANVFYIGSRGGSSLFFKGDIAEVILYSRALLDNERAIIDNYLIDKYLNFHTLAIGDFSDNAEVTTYDGHPQPSSMARAVFQTTAEQLTFDIYHGSQSPPYKNGAVALVDGVPTTIPVNIDAVGRYTTCSLAMGAGSKTVELIESGQLAGTREGELITRFYWPAGTVSLPAPSEPANRLLIYCDSIGQGALATTPGTENWVAIVRAAYNSGVGTANEGYGGRSLRADCQTALMRAAFVSKLAAAYEPDIVWIAMGVNDYILDGWNAADFGAAYADLLTKLAAEFSGATIFCQTPIIKTVETANTHGSTLGDYRTAIGDAVIASGVGVTVDGVAVGWPLVGDLADGLHPNTTGHGKIATQVKAVLGL